MVGGAVGGAVAQPPATAPDAVAQAGPRADAIRENLKRIRLPAGFRIELHAMVPGARHLAIAPGEGLVVVGTRGTTVWAVAERDRDRDRDGDRDGVAVDVRPFAPAIAFRRPTGVCWTRDGFLVVVEHDRVRNFPAAGLFHAGRDVAVIDVVGPGRLVPPAAVATGDGERICRIGPDGRLYIALGPSIGLAPGGTDPSGGDGSGGIVRMDPFDGSGREVHARGIRRPGGLAFHPSDDALWSTDGGSDGPDGDLPGEINRATGPGAHFGFPWFAGRSRTAEAGGDGSASARDAVPRDPMPRDPVPPQVETPPRSGDAGLAFYTGSAFPERYRGGLFSVQQGSAHGASPVGPRVLFTALKPDGTADRTEIFADGWLDPGSGTVDGRPVDVAVRPDGSLLISDERAGALYRVRYRAP